LLDLLIKAVKDIKINKLGNSIATVNENISKLQVLIEYQNNILDCLRNHLISSAEVYHHLSNALLKLSNSFQVLDFSRYQNACKIFEMMKIVPSSTAKPRVHHVKHGAYVNVVGCSTILGLPLQNNGRYNGATSNNNLLF